MRLCCCKIYKSTLKQTCPILYKIIFTKKYKPLKRILSFFLGVTLSIGFYYLILIDLNFTENASIIMTLVLCLLLGLGNAFSAQIRCITFLTLPAVGGKVGRGVIKTIVLAYIISGPVENLTNNGREVVRVFACTTTLTFNLTKTRFELMFKPFADALSGMKADVNEVKDTLRSMRDVSAPIVGEVEDESEMKKMKEENDYLDQAQGDSPRSQEIETKYDTVGEKIEASRFEKMYLKKIQMRCEDQFTRASTNCRNMFSKAYDTCYDTVSWVAAWLLCWPMKLDFVCNIAQAMGGESRCDPSKEIDPGFGEGYAYLKRSRSEFAENFKNVRLQYKIAKIVPPIDLQGTKESAQAILHTVQKRKRLLHDLLVIFKRILAFVVLRIILKAAEYHDRYVREIAFDNVYVTSYFRKIDVRRKEGEKITLLPLKKVEQKKLIDPCSPKPLKSENKQLVRQILQLLLEMITATTFVLLDRLFYEALDLVRRHARIDYVQTGRHDMTLQIKGTGLIANLLRSVVKGFNIKKRINVARSNLKCLPQPTPLPNYYIYKIYGTYFVILVLILVQMFTQRCRRIVCSFFYPKIEKRRVLYLYNETLRRRVNFLRYSKKRIKRLVRQRRLQENLNVCVALNLRYPKLFGWLRLFKTSRQRCLICNELEPLSCRFFHKKNNSTRSRFKQCPNTDCHFVYCLECWTDVGNRCLACASLDTTETSSSGSDSSTTTDQDD